METIRGIAVFPGVAIGPALVLDQEGLRIPHQFVASADVEPEIVRLERCLALVAEEIAKSEAAIAAQLGAEVASIFAAHRRMVSDPLLFQQISERMRGEFASAEYAVRQVLRKYEEAFRAMESSHFADRAADIRDIERQILSRLLGDRAAAGAALSHDVIVLAHDLTPSETVALDRRFVRGMATEAGGRTSHTAIVAGALEIPAVVGIGQFLSLIADGETVIIDGHRGVLIIGPDEPTLQKYRSNARDLLRMEARLAEIRDLPAETLDGARVILLGNIEFPEEAEHCVEKGADGIGLYRTEFLYLDRDRLPTEEEHYEAYAAVLRAIGPDRPVVFRTMDLGADKIHRSSEHASEPNPVLGLRSVRLALRNLSMFKTQLRALLRASTLGNLRIMFPLISTLMELRRCRMILADVMEDLQEEEVEFRRNIPIGMMVEVPSAALLAEQFAQEVDFFSIGTNDLIQYTLAVDRINETVASLYSASDPSVLKLVKRVVGAATRHRVPVGICGEMSGDPIYTLLLLGLGLRQLSVTPHNIPEIKKIIRSVTIAEARKVANRVLSMDTAGDVTNYLRNRTRHIVPELIDDLG